MPLQWFALANSREPSTILGTGLALAQPNGCSFPVVLYRVFFPTCSVPGVLSWVFRPGSSFPDVFSLAPRVFFPGRAIHSQARESPPQSLRAPVCSSAPSKARQFRPLWHVICARCGTSSVSRWHVICALCGTSSVPSVANQLCPLWHVSCVLWHVSCALCGTPSVPSVARHLCPRWHVVCALCGTSSVPSVASYRIF